MEKVATRIFIGASLVFGMTGILLVLVGGPDDESKPLNQMLMKVLMICVFVILPSFAFLVASKYLNGKN